MKKRTEMASVLDTFGIIHVVHSAQGEFTNTSSRLPKYSKATMMYSEQLPNYSGVHVNCRFTGAVELVIFKINI